ncbi:MAG: hypothetical protein WAQ28_18575 [Bacteroidia bacterium]
MKRKIVVELLENHEKVNFYTIRFVDEKISEFEKFYDKFDIEEFETDIDTIVYWIDKIGEIGALDRYFRPEGGKLKALPIDTSKLRLYCYKLTEGIVIIGNGGVKKTRTYNEDPLLNSFASVLKTIGTFLVSRINTNKVSVHNNTLYQNLIFSIEILHEKK